MQPCCSPRKLEPGTRPVRPSSASPFSLGGGAARLCLRVAGHHVIAPLPLLSCSSVILFHQEESSANWQTMMSDSGVWADPTLLRKRLISWDRPDFFNLGTTPPTRSTAGCHFSSNCFRLHISLTARGRDSAPVLERVQSRFT